MSQFILDSNIFITFSKLGRLDILERFFSTEYGNDLIMCSVVIKEVKGKEGLIRGIENIKEETNPSQETIDVLKAYYNAIKVNNPELHTKYDADYALLATAIKHKVDFIVTNDRAISYLFNKYKNKRGNEELKKINALNLSHFLALLQRSYKTLCNNSELASFNLDSYNLDEIPSHFKNMKMGECFKDEINPKKYCERLQSIFGNYKTNILTICR